MESPSELEGRPVAHSQDREGSGHPHNSRTIGDKAKATAAATVPVVTETFHDLERLGERLKGLRRLRGLTLQEVAESVGMSASFVSMLERGGTDISLARFSRLAYFYGIHPSELMLEDTIGARPQIEGIDDAPLIERGVGVTYRLIRRDQPQMMHVRFSPHSRFNDLRAHRGEDYCIVVDGAVDLLYGSERFFLTAGRTIRFSGVLPHGFDNPYESPATLIVVASVPYW